jgi:c-di-GMP-binding flagellar brake protein YcgR
MDTSAASLSREDVQIGVPLEWALVDACGALLYDSGATIANEQDADFLFAHFRPHRRTRQEEDADAANAACAPQPPDASKPTTLEDMHLSIGALLGIRSHTGGSAMHPSRLIGFSPSQTLFTTLPLAGGRPTQPMIGENVDVVAVSSHAVFRFACTIEAVCNHPFDYVVLSAPGVIRRLRERKAIRIRTRLPVRYASPDAGQADDNLGLANGISAYGMSLIAPRALGQVGGRLRVAFELQSTELGIQIETTAVIRNLHTGAAAATTHGLEFDQLEPAQQMALKSFVFDRQDDAEHWTGGPR